MHGSHVNYGNKNSVITKSEGKYSVTPKRISEELPMAFRAEIITPMMTCFRLLTGRENRVMHTLKNLV